MSGGIAYVYDPRAKFRALCNTAMVDLVDVGIEDHANPDDPARPHGESPRVDDNGLGDMLRFDAQRLRILVERHARLTGSARARMILADWANERARFVKVMPRDYRRALLELRSAMSVAAAE
jgi:glutamate synthase (NADPH/NADH) large chain